MITTTARRAALGCAVLCGALSCQQADSVVVVSVTTAPGLPPINQLRALMSNGSATSMRLYPEQPVETPLDFATAPVTFAIVVPRARTGPFDVAVDGLFAGASPVLVGPSPLVVASGAGRATLSPGERAGVAVSLLAGPSPCGNGVSDPGEQCDDGGRFSGDGCDFRCQREGSAGQGGQGQPGGAGGGAAPGGTGGIVAAGGAPGSGGLGAGGAPSTGGVPAGGAGMTGSATGGAPGTGGVTPTGGAVGTAGGDPALQVWYRFDDGAGTSAADASGKDRPGTLVSVAPGTATFSASGKLGGGAVDLMGQGTTGGGYVLLPGSLGALAPDAVTIACWVFLRASAAEARLFDFGVDANTSLFLTPRHTGLLGLGGDVIHFQIAQGALTQQSIEGTTALSSGGWHHVAVVLRSGSPYTGALYVDGALAGMNTSMTLHPSDLGVTTNNWLGRSTTSASDPFLDGLVDDFRLYSRALADSEIAALYQGATSQ